MNGVKGPLLISTAELYSFFLFMWPVLLSIIIIIIIIIIIGRAKRGNVKREWQQRIEDAFRLELGAPKVTASRRPALYYPKKKDIIIVFRIFLEFSRKIDPW